MSRQHEVSMLLIGQIIIRKAASNLGAAFFVAFLFLSHLEICLCYNIFVVSLKVKAMLKTALNNAQIEILDMLSFVKTQETLADLKRVISEHFADELEKEMNRLWETGEMTESKVEGFRNLHERTPYK